MTAVRGTGGLLLPLLVVAALSGVSCGREGANDPALAKETRGGATTSPETDPHSVVVEAQQLEGMKIETVRDATFQVEKTATGRIAFNEDVATPVFSPYTGRVLRLLAKPGDEVRRGVPLFEIDTPDLVQAESDLISAQAAVIKARNQLDLAQRAAARQRDLYEARAVAQKDYEQAQSDLRAAESDVRAAEGVHAGARDRLRVFGKTDAEIAKIEETRQIDRVTHVPSPLAGTITTRKVGPGQYVKPDNPDPLFTIADLSTMWMLANVYEADIPLIQVGQPVEVQVLAYPNEVFRARISYIGASADPTTHRIAVRAEVANSSRKLKPEMFAGFRILTSDAIQSPSVPARAIVREGNTPTVWVGKGPNRFTRREVKLGLEQNGIVQVLAGLQPGEQVVAEGALFLSNASRGAQ